MISSNPASAHIASHNLGEAFLFGGKFFRPSHFHSLYPYSPPQIQQGDLGECCKLPHGRKRNLTTHLRTGLKKHLVTASFSFPPNISHHAKCVSPLGLDASL